MTRPPRASLTVAGSPSTATAGMAHSVTVTAQDAFGNVATGYTGTVHFTSSDGQAVLPADYTFTAGDAGVHTFAVTLKTAGTADDHRHRHGDRLDHRHASRRSTVTAAAATQFARHRLPGAATTAGVAVTVTVTAQDAFGNVATGYTGTVHFTSSDAQAALPADYTFTGGDAGTHTFARDAQDGRHPVDHRHRHGRPASITGSQTGIAVSPAAASTLTRRGLPEPDQPPARPTPSPSRALDAYGNVATGYTGTVHFTSSDAQAALPANYTFTRGRRRRAHLLRRRSRRPAPSRSRPPTRPRGSITGTAERHHGQRRRAARLLAVTRLPQPPTTAGVAHTSPSRPTTPSATWPPATPARSTSPAATPRPPARQLHVHRGRRRHDTFTVTLEDGRHPVVTATDTATGSITGTQTGITVNAAAATHADVVAGFPHADHGGASPTRTVTAQDAYGNVATGYTGTVTSPAATPRRSLPANYTFTAGDAGPHLHG